MHAREFERERGDRTDGTTIDRLLGERDLVVVSNRQPYSHEREGGERTVTRPVGGLTAALDPVLQSAGGTWVAWGSGEADAEAVDDRDRVRVPPEDPAYELRRVWLDEEAVEGYYYGYSNRVLWPLCHSFPTLVEYDDADWETYRRVNDRFADAVLEEVDDDSLVWFHDYHLALAPGRVHDRRGAGARLVHFWHVPWPSWDVFRRCPHGRALLEGLTANDLIAFHTEADRRHFVECVERALDWRYDPMTEALVSDDGEETLVRVAPLSVDVDEQSALARSADATRYWRSFAAEHGLEDVRVAVGVDRLDYTKGIEHRLDALERFFEDHPEWRGELTYVQQASASRSRIEAYRETRSEVERRVDAINERFATDDWRPVVYCTDHVPNEGLAGLYRHADLALVSPLRDGMNLVAKEYVASQVDRDGVLLLSETAGAADQLGADAITVTPLETESFAEAIHRALGMDEGERRRRMGRLRETVRSTTMADWIAAQVSPLEAERDRFTDDATEYAIAK